LADQKASKSAAAQQIAQSIQHASHTALAAKALAAAERCAEIEIAMLRSQIVNLKKKYELFSIFFAQQSDTDKALAADQTQLLIQENQELQARLDTATGAYKHEMDEQRERHAGKSRKDYASFEMVLAEQKVLRFQLKDAVKTISCRRRSGRKS
jgi:hypothetical protein